MDIPGAFRGRTIQEPTETGPIAMYTQKVPGPDSIAMCKKPPNIISNPSTTLGNTSDSSRNEIGAKSSGTRPHPDQYDRANIHRGLRETKTKTKTKRPKRGWDGSETLRLRTTLSKLCTYNKQANAKAKQAKLRFVLQ